MKVSITPEQFGEAVEKELKDWQNETVKKAVNEAVLATAKQGAEMLKKGGPYKERTGKYSKDWTFKERKGQRVSITGTKSYSVCNKKHYRLTHLLEKGHLARDGSRVRPYEHIKPIEEKMEDLVVQEIGKRM